MAAETASSGSELECGEALATPLCQVQSMHLQQVKGASAGAKSAQVAYCRCCTERLAVAVVQELGEELQPELAEQQTRTALPIDVSSPPEEACQWVR